MVKEFSQRTWCVRSPGLLAILNVINLIRIRPVKTQHTNSV
jgi:hypothetical protein